MTEDIIQSGQRYVEDFLDTRVSLNSAALVHNDAIENTYNWNVRLQEEIESIALYLFSLQHCSGNMNHLSTYIKRIIHQI